MNDDDRSRLRRVASQSERFKQAARSEDEADLTRAEAAQNDLRLPDRFVGELWRSRATAKPSKVKVP